MNSPVTMSRMEVITSVESPSLVARGEGAPGRALLERGISASEVARSAGIHVSQRLDGAKNCAIGSMPVSSQLVRSISSLTPWRFPSRRRRHQRAPVDVTP